MKVRYEFCVRKERLSNVVTSTIQNIEILWTTIAVVGMLLAVYNFRSASRAIKHLRGLTTNHPEIMKSAKFSRTEELARLLIQTIETSIGVIAMTLPGSDPSQLPIKLQIATYMIQWGFIGTASLTLFQSFNSFLLRRFFLVEEEV